jgi:RHS repeat-associated protein
MNPGTILQGGGGDGGGGSGKGGSGSGGKKKAGTGDGEEDASGGGKEGEGGDGCGDPICPVTGRMFLDILDFAFAAPFPLRFMRSYNSRTSNVRGDLGYGWTHNFGWRLLMRRRHYAVIDDRGREQRLRRPRSAGVPATNAFGWKLGGTDTGFVLSMPKSECQIRFSATAARGVHWQTALVDRNGNRIEIERDENGVLRRFIDSAGRSYRVTSDAEGRILAISVAADASELAWIETVRYTYDAAGNLGSVSDAEGFTNQLFYDGHLVVEHRLACGLSYCYRYDGRTREARCIETWGEYSGRQDAALEHPLPLRPATELEDRKVKGINSVRFLYDDANRYTEAENGLGGVERFFGDETGRVVKHIDAAGGVTEKQYDPAHGSLIAESDESGVVRQARFDAEGKPAGFVGPNGEGTRVIADKDGTLIDSDERNGRVSLRRHDEHGRLIFFEHGDGTREEYEYDSRGLMTLLIDRSGAATRFSYDAMGNLVSTDYGRGGSSVSEYDYLGRRTRHTDRFGRTTEWRWNRRNEVVWKRHADGSETEVLWDANGKPVVFKEAGRTWSYSYGGLAWLTEIVGPRGDVTRFRYDVEGNLTFVENARGQIYRQRFDVASRPIGALTFEGVDMSGVLDVTGRMTSCYTPSGTTTSGYDFNGQLEQMEFPDGQVVKLTHLVGFGPTSIDNGTVLVENWYDTTGQVTHDKQGDHESTIKWSGGAVSAIVSDVGLPVEQSRDNSSDAVRLQVGSTVLGLHRANGSDHLSYLGRQLVHRRHSDVMGRLEFQALARRDPNLSEDGAATRSDPNLLWWASYEYDAAQYLRRETRSDGVVEYVVDAAGHITERRVSRAGAVVAAETLHYDLAGTPRLPGVVFDHRARPICLGNEVFEYDDEGRLICRRTPDGDWRYTWSGSACLTRVDAPGHVVEMDYDGRGRRMRKRVLRQGEIVASTSYVWSNHLVLHEVDELSGSTRTYARENDVWEPAGHVDVRAGVEKACFYVLDPAGALEFAVDETGNVVFRADRSVYAYGPPVVSDVDVSVRFSNQHYDTDVGLTYNRFRWYDARVGLFVSRDPLELDGTLNPRDFVPNPRRFIDPSGLVIQWRSSNPQPDGHGHPTRPDRPGPMTEDEQHTYLSGPGHFATNGTQDTPGYVVADDTERSSRNFRAGTERTIDAAGDAYGCHSCGRKRGQIEKEDGGFGHWRKDHQPPLHHVKAGDQARTAAGLAPGVVRIYPHCPRCSNTQGGLAESRPVTHAEAQRAAETMNPRRGDPSRRGPARR